MNTIKRYVLFDSESMHYLKHNPSKQTYEKVFMIREATVFPISAKIGDNFDADIKKELKLLFQQLYRLNFSHRKMLKQCKVIEVKEVMTRSVTAETQIAKHFEDFLDE